MALDYKLHKATEGKIDSLVKDKLDLKRREENLIKQIEQFQKDNKQLAEDKKAWELQKSLESRQITQAQESNRGTQEQTDKLLESVRGERDLLLKEKKALQNEIKGVKDGSERTKSILRRLEKEVEVLQGKEKALESEKVKVAGLEKSVKTKLKSIDEALNHARQEEKIAHDLLKRVNQKNSEANGLKIQLGIERKNLETMRRELRTDMSWVGQRRAELELAAREVRLKRRLLTKAYSMADLNELDTKVIQKIGW